MKKIIILIILLSFILVPKLEVYAETYIDKFIIAEEISGIYFGKNNGNETQYRKAKFKRRVSDQKIVYCIEPFEDMIENSNYNGYDYNYEKILNLSKETWDRVKLLSYYGYGYGNHTEDKWYAITQLLIWKEINKEADFYYTETFKGKRVDRFIEETNELNSLVNNHYKKISFADETIDISINSEIILEDKNQVLKDYNLMNYTDIIKIEQNKLVIKTSNEEKEIDIILEKKDNLYGAPPIIYVSNTYQNILSVGSFDNITTSFKLRIGSGNITILKKDKDTNSTTPQGEAYIEGTTYELYDEKNNYIDQIVINSEGLGILNNVKYGNYKLIEKVSGEGYLLDQNSYFFNINSENKEISLELYNQVIKRKIKLIKYKTEEDKNEYESNIIFQINNAKGEVIKEIITDEQGTALVELPYGKYTFKQINTSDGYYKVDDFEVDIRESSDDIMEYHLYDLKIPNTNQNSSFTILFSTSLILIFTSLILVIKNAKSN